MFVNRLNAQFCTSEAVSHGEEMGMGRRNVMYTLSKLQRLGVITQKQHGKYEKTPEFDGF
jgi:predicted transcriptional regulator